MDGPPPSLIPLFSYFLSSSLMDPGEPEVTVGFSGRDIATGFQLLDLPMIVVRWRRPDRVHGHCHGLSVAGVVALRGDFVGEIDQWRSSVVTASGIELETSMGCGGPNKGKLIGYGLR